MSNFFKNIGKGVLYVLSFPFILVAIVITGVVGVFIFIYQFFKNIVLFFMGRSIFKPLDEDIKAQAILNGTKPSSDEEEKPSTGVTDYSDYQVYTPGSFNNTVPEHENDIEPEPDNDDEEGGMF